MPKNAPKQILIVAAGVLVAGFLMQQMRGNTLLDQARGGYN